jgi:hypothetical protein
MARARGYAPLEATPDSIALVERIATHARESGPGAVAVFDLDGCLFDTRPRQVRIFRELANRAGLDALYKVREEHFVDWSLDTTMRNAGLEESFVATHRDTVRSWWARHFFTSAYVEHDHAMPGAPVLVRAVHESGVHVVYLTGRDTTMKAGTERSLRAWGFPYDVTRTTLLVKPTFEMDDTEFKEGALAHVETLGRVVLYLDNEPANVNVFRRVHPESLVVFVETDHSPRPDEPDASLPWLRSFLSGPR